MSRWMNRLKEEGVSLRLTFLLMFFISLGITVVLLLTTYQAIHSYHSLSNATDNYIDLQEAADSLMKASDYLTEEAQCYAVMGERRHLDNYFMEAEVTRRREHAIEVMESRLPDSEALVELKNALQESIHLMDKEYYAMKLVSLVEGDANVPEAIKAVSLSKADQDLPDDEKMRLARDLMHNDDYYSQKKNIQSHLSLCINKLKENTHDTQNHMGIRVHADLVWMTMLILIQSLALMLLLWATTSLGINPLIRAVDHIKHDQELPITGAHEFRYLAETYNKMYSAYKRSIENLSFKASHDDLTHVYNRAGFDLIKHSVDLNSTVFLLIDADRFKEINDSNGHEIGDLVLKKISGVLRTNFRADDYICRIGGDEFVVLMVHIGKDVRPLIEQKVIQINRDLANTDDGLPFVSVSVGVSMGQGLDDPQAMFHQADIALYYVKDHGRNGCCFYSPDMKDIQT